MREIRWHVITGRQYLEVGVFSRCLHVEIESHLGVASLDKVLHLVHNGEGLEGGETISVLQVYVCSRSSIRLHIG